MESENKRKVFILPEDVDDPHAYGEAWAVVASMCDLQDEVHVAKAKTLWWACYRQATEEAATRARFDVRKTGRIGTPENRQLEQEILADESLELVGPWVLDMGEIFEDAKWRFHLAWRTFVSFRSQYLADDQDPEEEGETDDPPDDQWLRDRLSHKDQ